MFGYDEDRPAECIDRHKSACEGVVAYRASLSGTGMPIARCEGHYADRLDFQREIDRRYPAIAPADFDPSYAGESWDEDY